MNNFTAKQLKEFAIAAQNNFEAAFRYRHATRQEIWGLPDEIVEKALESLEEWGLDYTKNDAASMYDNLAINAEIIAKEDAKDGGIEESDALFTTESYYVMSW